jgi:hypothetical protein
MFRAAFFGPARLRQLVGRASKGIMVSAAVTAAGFGIRVHAASTTDEPTISGTPASLAIAGNPYAFQPSAHDAEGQPLSFSVKNKPAWASFSIATGSLYGAPSAAQAGTYGNIEISVSNGTSTATLPAFSITVTNGAASTAGSATLNWVLPTENTNGTALTDLAGVLIYYGTGSANLDHIVQVPSAGDRSHTIGNLAAGVWYFAAAAYTSTGTQSALSPIVSKSIP